MSNNELKFYNSTDIWEQEVSEKQNEVLNDILKFLPKDIKSVLDIGCGNGVVTNNLPKDIYVCGLDISEEALKYIKRDKVIGSIEKLPFKDKEFDLVLTTDTIEHLPDDIYYKGFKEMERVAKKYILIVTPYKEDLEYAKTKCYKCGCKFHVNWHLHSLDIQKITDSFKKNSVSLRKMCFSGEMWPLYFNEVDEIDRIINKKYPYWDKAVCPNCGAIQDHNDINSNNISMDKLKNKYFEEKLDQFIYNHPTKNEVVLLYEKVDEETEDYKKNINFYIKTKKSMEKGMQPNVKLVQKHRNDIIVASEFQKKAYTEKFYMYPYLLINNDTNWGIIEEIDGRLVRSYLNLKTTFNHAVFVVPKFTSDIFSITISYKDCSDVSLIVQIYDKNIGYYPIGELDSKNDGKWKTIKIDILGNIAAPEEGFMFDLVAKEVQKEVNYYFDKILVNSSFTSEKEMGLTDIVYEEDDDCYLFDVNIQEITENMNLLKIQYPFEGILELGFTNLKTSISIECKKVYNNIHEAFLYPWLVSDKYIQQNFDIVQKSENDIQLDIASKIMGLLLKNISNYSSDYYSQEFLKWQMSNVSLQNYIKSQLEALQNTFENQNCKYEKEIESKNAVISKITAMNEVYNNKINEIEKENSKNKDEILLMESKITEYKYKIENLENRKLWDYILKKGGN